MQLRAGLIPGGGAQRGGIGSGIIDIEIPDVLEVVEVSAGDGGGLCGPRRHGTHSTAACWPDGRRSARWRSRPDLRRRRRRSPVRSAGMDVVSTLQGVEVLDPSRELTSLFEELGVDDDAEGFVAVADGLQFASLIVEVEGVGVQLVGDGGAGQIQCVIVPVSKAGHVADVEDGGRFALAHLGGQGVGVGAGSSGNNLDGNAGLGGVVGSELLQRLVELRLEVQVVDLAGRGSRSVVGSGVVGLGLSIGGVRGVLSVVSAGVVSGVLSAEDEQATRPSTITTARSSAMIFFHFVFLLKILDLRFLSVLETFPKPWSYYNYIFCGKEEENVKTLKNRHFRHETASHFSNFNGGKNSKPKNKAPSSKRGCRLQATGENPPPPGIKLHA